MKITQRKVILFILAFSIAFVALLNILIVSANIHSLIAVTGPHLKPSSTSRVQGNITQTFERTCNTADGHIPPVNTSNAAKPGSVAESILPPHQYPIIHRSCYFLPTSPRDHVNHSYLLQYYPNSFLVVTGETEKQSIRLDPESRTIYIRGADDYNLLWIKTMILWDYISSNSNNEPFAKCNWFFKVDTDAFLNLHTIEQYLSQYLYKDDHYLGWYAGNGGRKRNNLTVNMAIGAFYGFSRGLIEKWYEWNTDNKFTWGHVDDHKGEDSQVSFFLREHGVCLDVPVRDTVNLKNRGGVWEGFDRAHPLGIHYFREACTKKIRDMVENECFTYAHKVWLEWMPVMADVLRSHVERQTTCGLFGRGVSRVVNGSVYQRVQEMPRCTVTDCDPCLKDSATGGCCGWALRK